MKCPICHDTGRFTAPDSSGLVCGYTCPNGCMEKVMEEFNRGLTYEQIIARFGGRFVGESIVQPHSDHMGRPIYTEAQS